MIAGLVLAAGAGKRFGKPKASVEISSERLVDRAVSQLLESGCEQVFVVLGAWISAVPNATVLINENWKSGMASSLKVGLEKIISIDEISTVLITLVDLPGMNVAAFKRVLETKGDLVVGVFNSQRGHPVKFEKKHFSPLLNSLRGDEGARSYINSQNSVIPVELSDVADGHDLDTPEDLKRFL
jgi:CTP:molybdopterin cytidylyltransferase MocA